MHLLVLRPEPGAGATAARIRAAGEEATVAPLFSIAPVSWSSPDASQHDALLLTSANAIRHAGAQLAALAGLPAYAVGEATAAAARQAGLTIAAVGDGDARALLARVAAAGIERPLHLCGADHVGRGHAGLSITRRIVYRAEAAATLAPPAMDALADGAVALLHSPRAAALFADLVARAELRRDDIRIAAISPVALDAAGEGWAARAVAVSPNDDTLLAAAAGLCKTGAGKTDRRGA
jgi:uroporphyrinogen-III synthase